MAYTTTVNVGNDAIGVNWVHLTAPGAAAGNISLTSIDNGFWVKPMATATPPTDSIGAIFMPANGAILNMTIAQIFAGNTGTFLYARAKLNANAFISVA